MRPWRCSRTSSEAMRHPAAPRFQRHLPCLSCYFETGEHKKGLASGETQLPRVSSQQAIQAHLERMGQKMAASLVHIGLREGWESQWNRHKPCPLPCLRHSLILSLFATSFGPRDEISCRHRAFARAIEAFSGKKVSASCNARSPSL
jgi:hypothetical protein